MSLDVTPPDPPDLSPQDAVDGEATGAETADYRRDELQTFLADGAWAEAFETWAADTDVDQEAWGVVRDLDLIAEFDFFWDDFAGRVGYHAPGLPEDWREREVHPDIDSWETVSAVNAGLTELGQTVCDVLKEEYIDWESDFEADGDLPEY